MPDVEADPTATPQTSTQTPTSGQPTPTETAGFTAEDFKDPYWGTKAKNILRLHEKDVDELRRLKTERDEMRGHVDRWNGFLSTHTDLQQAVRDRIEGKQSSAAAEPPEETNEESDTLAAIRKELRELRGLLHADKAMLPIYSELGNGNIAKGEQIFKEQWSGEMRNIGEAWTRGDPGTIASMSFELARLRKDASKPKAPPEPSGSIAADADGGTVEVPMTSPQNRKDAEQALMRQLGVNSDAGFEKMMAQLD